MNVKFLKSLIADLPEEAEIVEPGEGRTEGCSGRYESVAFRRRDGVILAALVINYRDPRLS